jgi:hypothetical protein
MTLPADKTKSSTNDLSGVLNLDYYYLRNSEKYQGNFSTHLFFRPSLSTSRQPLSFSRDNNFFGNIQISSTNRFFNAKKQFFEVDPNLSVDSRTTRRRTEVPPASFQEENSDQLRTSVSVPFSVGFGRIEPVEDARLAVYILEELDKAGRMSKSADDSVVIEMAKLISKIKNKRFFDARIRKIRELQVIDSFLLANDLISSHDISYFAVLNDQWDYASGPQRETGFAVNAGINNHVSLLKDNHETLNATSDPVKNEDSSNSYSLGAFLKMRYAKPVNLYWQNSFNVVTSIGRTYFRNPDNKTNLADNYDNDFFMAELVYSWSFFPDSRTSVNMSLRGTYENSDGDHRSDVEGESYHLKTNQISFYPTISIYYYISPQMRIQFNPSVTVSRYFFASKYYNGDPILKSNWNYYQHNISFQFIYSFF